jgi:hypothetical protein
VFLRWTGIFTTPPFPIGTIWEEMFLERELAVDDKTADSATVICNRIDLILAGII